MVLGEERNICGERQAARVETGCEEKSELGQGVRSRGGNEQCFLKIRPMIVTND